ncbi:glycosyltransferase [Thiospirochaeta perfilievii]|uniref:Glycosyltransferase n=1 Tax=Thiospirochaeta perfilievii TaxID=252967 RepID=A0A5C1QH97_9SPIO|nr:glycosyltransferase family 4 protein [Thiospirochaeta perfilievii]QEN05622.1 glycosyltransferase [Thiospirochaeta perfilievii]
MTQIPSYPFDKIYDGYTNIDTIDYYKGIKIHRVKTFLGYNKSTVKKIGGYLLFAFFTWKKAFNLAKNIDKVFFYHTGPATMAHSSMVFKKIYKKKCYIWTQDIWPDAIYAYGIKKTFLSNLLLKTYLKKLYKNFDKVFVSCPGFISIVKTYYSREIKYIPQWYPLENDVIKIAKLKSSNEKLQFTFLGNLGTAQNLENVCLGFLKAVDDGLDATLNIVGDGVSYTKLKQIIDNSKTDKIILWGRKPQSEMNSFLEMSDVMIVSLADDPLLNMYIPAKFQGYLCAGKPILGILNGEVSKIIKINSLGVTVSPSNIEEISKSFESFVGKKDRIIEFRKNSSIFYEKNYLKFNSIANLITNIQGK